MECNRSMPRTFSIDMKWCFLFLDGISTKNERDFLFQDNRSIGMFMAIRNHWKQSGSVCCCPDVWYLFFFFIFSWSLTVDLEEKQKSEWISLNFLIIQSIVLIERQRMYQVDFDCKLWQRRNQWSFVKSRYIYPVCVWFLSLVEIKEGKPLQKKYLWNNRKKRGKDCSTNWLSWREKMNSC